MNKFKFGDRVRHAKYGDCIFIEAWEDCDTGEQSWVTVLSSCGATADVAPDSLELLPHPDTVRLDWIEQRSHAARETAILYDGYSWRGHINEDTPIELGFPYETLRQAVDESMNNAPDTETQQ